MAVFRDLYNELISEGVIEKNNTGCSESEIEEIERKYNIVLTDSYKEFLKLCGHSCVAFDKKEFNYKYKHIECMTEQVLQGREQLMEAAGESFVKLPEKVFFIMDRYGYEFDYIVAESGVDSGVYFYNYHRETSEKVFESIGEWFKAHALGITKL
jgi:hypothetical protein